MAKLSEILGDKYNTLSEDIKIKYKDIDLVDSSKYVEKIKFDEVKQAKKQLETDVKDRDTQLETLKKSVGDNATLKQQIEQLQNDNKKKDEEYQAELKDLKLTNAIKLAITDSAQDIDLVTGLIDKSKLILSEDGKVTGLDEQVTGLKESKSFLFKSEESNQNTNIQFSKSTNLGNNGATTKSLSELMQAKNANPNMEVSFK
ncbi:minor structural GP20 protein [[Clostridium] sordellii]|uniref:phage scaffolding protein n=1 Tax=Paraclostridium sordellii TaxID=1505 RepID=UPI0005DEF953|nr:phage scaffolding protein [Paeniclostridium sordellii]MDU2686705.1 phage scaffolding protein [Paeniclostridium sordellii]CEN81366.1 minor structural GP20 protein [[Clostridium] sordellii] [Paeniclostridium sordellii]CEO09353.1 minor structural GP20 protein [[Clostridium] sordellii] [Paeniclostridium sordellii]